MRKRKFTSSPHSSQTTFLVQNCFRPGYGFSLSPPDQLASFRAGKIFDSVGIIKCFRPSLSATTSENHRLSIYFCLHGIPPLNLRRRSDPSPAGLLAAIEVVFSDGTSTLIATDISNDWNAPDTDMSTWSASNIISPYGQGPWGNQVTLPASISTTSLSFSQSSWIWSAEANPSLSPPDPRVLRKTFNASDPRTLKSALVIITVDDGFQLYVDGNVVGSSPNETDIWKSAKQFTVPLSGIPFFFLFVQSREPSVRTVLSLRLTLTDDTWQVLEGLTR